MHCTRPVGWVLIVSIAGTAGFLLAMWGVSTSTVAVTTYLIRHAEKPLDPADEHLSVAGRFRADCLGDFFANSSFGVGRLFATGVRPRETLEPLAARLGLVIDTNCGKNQIKCLQTRLTAAGQDAAVVSWTHEQLPAIVYAMGVRNAPDWSGYAHIWVVSGSQMRVADQPPNCTWPGTLNTEATTSTFSSTTE